MPTRSPSHVSGVGPMPPPEPHTRSLWIEYKMLPLAVRSVCSLQSKQRLFLSSHNNTYTAMVKPSFNKKNSTLQGIWFLVFYLDEFPTRCHGNLLKWSREPLDSIAKDVKMHSSYGKQFSFSSV